MTYRESKTFIFFLFPAFLSLCCIYNPFGPIKGDGNQSKPFCFDSLNVEEINELTLGSWEWTHSIIMQRHIHPPDNIITPESAGYTKQRYFEKNDSVSFFKDNQLVGIHKYEIKKFKVLPDDKGYIKEIYIDELAFQLYFSHPDTMMIGNGWLDGIDEYFVRKKL
jgi:hypothetical protein